MVLDAIVCAIVPIILVLWGVDGGEPENEAHQKNLRDLLHASFPDANEVNMSPLFSIDSTSSGVGTVPNFRSLKELGVPGLMRMDLSRILGDHLTSRGKVFDLLQSAQAIANNGTFIGGNPVQFEDFNIVKLTRSKQDGELWSGALPLQNFNVQLIEQSLSHGFTLLLNKINHRQHWLTDLGMAMEDAYTDFLNLTMSPRCNINLYLTSGETSQGFEAHFDWMDVLVLQVLGQKTWTVYNPVLVQSPTVDQKFKPTEAFLGTLKKHKVVMRPGDALFLPAGVVHEARTATNLDSLHLSLGFEVDEEFTWAGLLHFSIQTSQEVLLIRILAHTAVARATRVDTCLRGYPHNDEPFVFPCGNASGLLAVNTLSVEQLLHYLEEHSNIVSKIAVASGEQSHDVESIISTSFSAAALQELADAELREAVERLLYGQTSLDKGKKAMIATHLARKAEWRSNMVNNAAMHLGLREDL